MLNDLLYMSQFFNTGTKVNVKESEKEYVIEMVLPGFKKEDINILVDGNKLTIEAVLKEKKESTDRYIVKEIFNESVRRSFSLLYINPENITAKYENGILTVNIKKKTGSSSKKIEIL